MLKLSVSTSRTQHSLLQHLHSEVVALKKSLRREKVSADDPLDEFVESAGASWKAAVEAIGGEVRRVRSTHPS